MDLIVFVVLLVIALILFIAGSLVDVNVYVMGFAVLFLAGLVVLTSDLQYDDGVNITKNFTYGTGEYNMSVTGMSEVQLPVKSSFSGNYQHLVGWGLAVVSIAGTALVYVNFYGKKDEEGEL